MASSLPMALRVYRRLSTAMVPLSPALIKRRLKLGKEDPARIAERRGLTRDPRPNGPLVWIHGASVGEVLAAAVCGAVPADMELAIAGQPWAGEMDPLEAERLGLALVLPNRHPDAAIANFTIGENITLRRSATLEVGTGAIAAYVHGKVAERHRKFYLIIKRHQLFRQPRVLGMLDK